MLKNTPPNPPNPTRPPPSLSELVALSRKSEPKPAPVISGKLYDRAAAVLASFSPGDAARASDEALETALVSVYRADNPGSRVESLWHYTCNKRKITRSCILCRCESSWRRTTRLGRVKPRPLGSVDAEENDKACHIGAFRAFLVKANKRNKRNKANQNDNPTKAKKGAKS